MEEVCKYRLTNKVKEVTYKVIHLIYPVREVDLNVSYFLNVYLPNCFGLILNI